MLASPGLHRQKWRCCSSSSPETASLQLRGIVGCGDARGKKNRLGARGGEGCGLSGRKAAVFMQPGDYQTFIARRGRCSCFCSCLWSCSSFWREDREDRGAAYGLGGFLGLGAAGVVPWVMTWCRSSSPAMMTGLSGNFSCSAGPRRAGCPSRRRRRWPGPALRPGSRPWRSPRRSPAPARRPRASMPPTGWKHPSFRLSLANRLVPSSWMYCIVHCLPSASKAGM
jgi:hypothetical protein